jgi:ribonuclease D
MARTPPSNLTELKQMKVMRNRGPRRFVSQWHDAIERALGMPDTELPRTSARRDGPPPPRTWADKFPDAADRLGRSREAITAIAGEYDVPTENLLAPQLVRGLAWDPPETISVTTVTEILTAGGARPWQVELTGEPLTKALLSG